MSRASHNGIRLEVRWHMVFLAVAALTSWAPAYATPGIAPPLTNLSRGETHQVRNVPELLTAIQTANLHQVPTTVLLEDGAYTLAAGLELRCPGLVVRSASGARDAVVVRGPDDGPKATVGNVFLVAANDIVIADLTLGWCRYHGVQIRGESPFDVSGTRIHNCHLIDCNEQFIKGSSADTDPMGATDGVIEGCTFEFSRGWAYQYYTGGIDIHKGVRWVVRDNLFRNLRVPPNQPGLAEHAIHFWKRCSTTPQDVIVVNNRILNCDRGIGFGLVDAAGGHQGGRSLIRANEIYNDGVGPRTDVGIGLEHANGVRIENNSVLITGYPSPIEFRFPSSSNLVFVANLANAPIRARDGAPRADTVDNLDHLDPAWFPDLARADFRPGPAAPKGLPAGAHSVAGR